MLLVLDLRYSVSRLAHSTRWFDDKWMVAVAAKKGMGLTYRKQMGVQHDHG